MEEDKELPIEVIDDVEKLKEYMKVNGLSYFIGKTACECKKERDICLLIQTPYIISEVIVCEKCYKNKNYPIFKYN
jgi:hypothetical protein